MKTHTHIHVIYVKLQLNCKYVPSADYLRQTRGFVYPPIKINKYNYKFYHDTVFDFKILQGNILLQQLQIK